MRIFGLLILVLWIAGCSLTPDVDKAKLRGEIREKLQGETSDEVKLAKFERGKLGSDLIGLAQYALLANAAYEPRPFSKKHIKTARSQNRPVPQFRAQPTGETLDAFCKYKSKYAERWHHLMKYSSDFNPDYIDLPERVLGITRSKIPGLKYQVWRDRLQTGRNRIAIVFRGTVIKEWGDWYSNFRPLTRLNIFTWDQYQQTRRLLEKLVPELKDEFGQDTEIITVGHSLGGGLAQQAAYASDQIDLVYAFANSPITGYTSVDRKRVNNRTKNGVKIYRIYEAGEILAAIRWPARQFVPLRKKNPEINEVRFNMRTTYRPGSSGGGPTGQHSMEQFACDLICNLEAGKDHETCKRTAYPKKEE